MNRIIAWNCVLLERKKVIEVRLRNYMLLFYQWYFNSKPVGTKLKIDLDGGDLYIMSEVTKRYYLKQKKFIYFKTCDWM